MTVQGVSHFSITVRNLERSIAFYRDVIGLPIVVRNEEDMSPMGKGWRKVAFLRWVEGPLSTCLVLDEWPPKDTIDKGAAQMFQIGLNHFSFWVSDLDAIAKRAREAGSTFIVEPLNSGTEGYGEPPGKLVRTAIFQDPDGNVVQLDQRV